MKKRLFDKDDRYTAEAQALDNEVCSALKDIIDKYVKEGYSIRDIEYIAGTAAGTMCIIQVLNWSEPNSEV